jgi:hypothetical protein
MKNAFLLSLSAIVMLLIAGCGAHEAKWSAEAAQYAAYATQIPLYPGTKITDAMGGESWGDGPETYSYGMNWSCETKATREELVAWYEARLPNAQRRTTDLGWIELTVIPKNAKPGEDMGVRIESDGKYSVFENRKNKNPRA